MIRRLYNPLTRKLDLINDPAANPMVAGQRLFASRAVTLDGNAQVIHADHTNLDHAGGVIGLTSGGAESGKQVIVVSFGVVADPSWSWDITKPSVFLSTSGQLTQTPPISGFFCVLGYALSATQLSINIKPPINLA